MIKPSSRALALALLAAGALTAGAESPPPLVLVPRLDLARYAGKWYEVARYQQGFERGLVGVTAEYDPRPDGRLDVVNAGYKNSLGGTYSSVKAIAWRPDPARPGALKVRFFGLFGADYLVFGLDEKEYSWALVGDDSRRNLWFLSRTPSPPAGVVAEMRAIAESQGYDLSKLYLVPQG